MQRRKDNKGRVLKDGEVYRKSDGLYMYRWTAKNGKRHTIYDATLEGLREKEEKIQHDLADGIRIPECSLTLNDLFELWRKNKVGLKEHTFANYVYMYNRFVRDEIGMMKLKDIRKSDIRSYYNGIVRNGKMALNTLETIQNVLHQVFAVAVDDEYIRVNPTDGVLTAIKAAHQYETPKRHALTLPQQQAFLNFIKKTPKFQHWLPMFTFMLGTGCRISETVGLCWGDIDFERGLSPSSTIWCTMTTRSVAAISPCPPPRLPPVSGQFQSCPKCGKRWSRNAPTSRSWNWYANTKSTESQTSYS